VAARVPEQVLALEPAQAQVPVRAQVLVLALALVRARARAKERPMRAVARKMNLHRRSP
jgi:hypothetical protein